MKRKCKKDKLRRDPLTTDSRCVEERTTWGMGTWEQAEDWRCAALSLGATAIAQIPSHTQNINKQSQSTRRNRKRNAKPHKWTQLHYKWTAQPQVRRCVRTELAEATLEKRISPTRWKSKDTHLVSQCALTRTWVLNSKTTLCVF